VSLSGSGITRAQTEPSAEELELLEQSLAADATEEQGESRGDAVTRAVGAAMQSLNPDMSVILDVAAAWFSEEPLQAGAHDPNTTGFTLQQLELHLSANVDPFFRFDTNIVFAQFGVEVEEAYGTTLGLPWSLQVRAGQFLTRFGRINATHPHSWSFADQPLVTGKFFGGEGSRGLGMEASWLAPLPWYVELVASGTDPSGECCARSFYGGSGLGIERLQDVLLTTAVKQFFPLDDDWSLLWGLSGQLGPNATGNNNRTDIYGSDLLLRYRPVAAQGRTSVSLQAEVMLRVREVPGVRLEDWGGYAQLVWEIDREWAAGARVDFVRAVAGDPLDPEQVGDRHRTSAQITFYPSLFSRLRLQGNADVPAWRTEPIFAVILNLELVVGAHGAHSY
jgi:hypothetical protein